MLSSISRIGYGRLAGDRNLSDPRQPCLAPRWNVRHAPTFISRRYARELSAGPAKSIRGRVINTDGQSNEKTVDGRDRLPP